MYSGLTAQVISPGNDFTLFVVVIAISFFIMSVFLIVVVINIYKQRVRNQKKVLDAIYSTQENERERIAEDLHDSIGANLSALKLRLDAIREDSIEPATAVMASDSMAVLDHVIVDLRNIIRNQASRYLLDNGFNSELMRFKSYFSDHNKIKLVIEINKPFPELKNNFGVNLFRIIQELINNSVKHSQCSNINIYFSHHNNQLKIDYADDGKGFDNEHILNKGMGLANIDARVKLFNGRYELKSEPGVKTYYNFVFDYTG